MAHAIIATTLAVGAVLVGSAVAAWLLIRVWPRGLAGKALGFSGIGVASLLALVAARAPAAFGLLLLMIFPWELVWSPNEDFYRAEFEAVSGLDFPASGAFLATHSTTPHAMFGDYVSCGAFTVSPADYGRLASALAGERVPLPRWIGSECLDRVTAALEPGPSLRFSRDERPESDLSLAWGVLDDGRTVLFQKLQW